MGTVTEPGFHNGRFRQGGQYAEGVETNDDADADDAPNYGSLTRDELVALAKERGIQHAANAPKAEIVAALEAAG